MFTTGAFVSIIRLTTIHIITEPDDGQLGHSLWPPPVSFLSTKPASINLPSLGSTNVDCIGYGTITTTQKELDQADADRSAAISRRRVSIIVGVVLLPVLFLLLIGAITSYLRMRRGSTKGVGRSGDLAGGLST